MPSSGCSYSTSLASSSAAGTSFTADDGTPASRSTASHSSDERSRNTASRIGSSSSRLRSRAAKSANRGSPASSGLPIAAHSASQNFCFGQATTIQPSAVGKAWKGTIDGWAELRRRGGV